MRYQAIMVALLIWAMAARGWSQVELRLKLEHTRTLRHEPVPATVHIRNLLHTPLQVNGPDADVRLLFDVRCASGRSIGRFAEPEPFSIPPRGSLSGQYNLLKYNDLRLPGSYVVRARVDLNDKIFHSVPSYLDVLPGLELSATTASVSVDGTLRRFSLNALFRDRGEWLFLKVEDADRKYSYGVHNLGRLLRQFPPQLGVDAYGLAHILHLSGPSRYIHHVFLHDGQLVERTAYAARGHRPALVESPGGGINVQGAPLLYDDPPPDS